MDILLAFDSCILKMDSLQMNHNLSEDSPDSNNIEKMGHKKFVSQK